jgi:hypothetical protein
VRSRRRISEPHVLRYADKAAERAAELAGPTAAGALAGRAAGGGGPGPAHIMVGSKAPDMAFL